MARLLRAAAERIDAGEPWREVLKDYDLVLAAFPEPASIEGPIMGTWSADDRRRWFVAGAAWWEYESRGATMWSADRDRAEAEAERRYADMLATRVRP